MLLAVVFSGLECDLLWFFLIIQLTFSKSTGWISTIKISQESFNFQKVIEKNTSGLVLCFGNLVSR